MPRTASSSRDAILAAIDATIKGGELSELTATGLARKAGVSRRTIFNHFASLDEAVVEHCAQVFSALGNAILERDTNPETATVADLFHNTANALVEADLPEQIAYFDQVINSFSSRQEKTNQLFGQVFGQLSYAFQTGLQQKYPNISVLDIRLTVGSLFLAVSLCAREWVPKYSPVPGHLSRKAREDWQENLQHAFARLESGLGR